MRQFEPIPNPELSPEAVMDDLVVATEMRLGEAIRRQLSDPYTVWFTDGTDPVTYERVVWYRLGETHMPQPDSEVLDVGIVVAEADIATGAALLEPVRHELGDRHFYVRKPQVERSTIAVNEKNSLQVVQPHRRRTRHGVDITPIAGLSMKLSSGPGGYHLHPLRVRHAP